MREWRRFSSTGHSKKEITKYWAERQLRGQAATYLESRKTTQAEQNTSDTSDTDDEKEDVQMKESPLAPTVNYEQKHAEPNDEE